MQTKATLRALATTGLAALLAASPAMAEPVAEMPQQMQLDEASRQELWRQQHPSAHPQLAPPLAQRRLNEKTFRQQNLQQQMLQESQRRELLMRQQRARTNPNPGLPPGLEAINRQWRNQLEQRRQLEGFRGPLWPPVR